MDRSPLPGGIAEKRTAVHFGGNGYASVVASPPTTPLTSLPSSSLPMADGVPHERADAARNRRRLLDAAQRLVAEQGADHVTMEAVAAAAEVGKGTVFRRFGDRSGLMRALLDHSSTEMQDAFLRGPAPLGPDAPPTERLVAFGRAMLAMLEIHGEILRAADSCPSQRFSHPTRGVHAAHVAALLRDAGVDGDLPLLVDALLGALDPSLVLHQVQTLGMSYERLGDGWADLVVRITGGD